MRAIFRRDSVLRPDQRVTISTTLSSTLGSNDGSSSNNNNSINFDVLSECLDLFLGNEFLSCLSFCSQQERTSVYHAFAKSVLCFLNACTAPNRNEIEAATASLESGLKMCYASRRRGSLINLLSHVLTRGTNYDQYTDLEVHTELISVETRLMLILLQLMRREEGVSAFLKRSSDHIKYCVSSFRACLHMIKSGRSWDSEASQRNFKSGLYLAIGVFNVVLALLPDKVQRVLQESDCSGDKELGATYLTQAVELPGVQQSLARLVVTAMDFLVEPAFLRPLADTCLQQLQQQHPKSAFLSYLTGKRRLSQRQLTRGNEVLKDSVSAQTEWTELQSACWSDLMWSNALLLDWDRAIFYAVKLTEVNQSACLPEVHYYILAAFLFMKEVTSGSSGDDASDFRLSSEARDQIEDCMKRVKGLKKYGRDEVSELQRISLNAAKAFLDDGRLPLLPAIELMFHLDLIKNMPIEKLVHVVELIDRRFNHVVVEQQLLPEMDESVGPALDDYCTLKLLRAVCHKHLAKVKPAVESLKEVIERKERVKDANLVGHAMMQLGLLLCDNGQALEGRFWLKTVKEEASGVLADLRRLMTVDAYLRYAIPNSEEEFTSPGVAIGRRPSAADVQVKVVKKLVRRRSSSIGFDHSAEFDSHAPGSPLRAPSLEEHEPE